MTGTGYVTESQVTLLPISGVARNFRQSVAFVPMHPCSAALPSRHTITNVMMHEQLHVTGQWALAAVNK